MKPHDFRGKHRECSEASPPSTHTLLPVYSACFTPPTHLSIAERHTGTQNAMALRL